MKFNLHRDPSNKLQKIPYSVMQIAGLADRKELTLQADEGCILIKSRPSLHERGHQDGHSPGSGDHLPGEAAGRGQ